MDYQSYIQNLKKEIDTYVKLGGDVTAPKRQLPYYDKIHCAIRKAEREKGIKYSINDIYAQCGIKFDKDFIRYEELLKNLKNCVNSEGFIDLNGSATFQKKADTLLKDLSIKVNLTPSEYLILMTPYRSQIVMTTGNYIEHVKEGLAKAYPDGIVKDIKRQHNDLYEQVRHFQKYSPIPISFNECLEFFGFINGNSNQLGSQKKEELQNKEEIIEKLSALYPNNEVGHLISQDKSLYNQVVYNARANDQTLSQWLNLNGFSYQAGQNALRLSRYKVDGEEHEKMLLDLKANFIKEYNTENADEIDMFRINTEIAKKISEEIHNEALESTKSEDFKEITENIESEQEK